METIWVLLTAAQVVALRDQLRDEHRRNRPGHALSVTRNIANTRAIVKIVARPAVIAALNLHSVPFWTRDTHATIFADLDFYGPEWQQPE